MPRLITFGCSYTFGHGLPDCLDQLHDGYRMPPTISSSLGWPNMLANKLSRTLVNVSSPGASNLEILYSILKFDFHENDQIIIMWTHNMRDIVFTDDDMDPILRIKLGPWRNEKYAQQWALKASERDYALKTWIYIHHADLFLEKKKVNWLHYPAVPFDLQEFKFDFITSKNISFNGFEYLDYAEDNKHPGLRTQQLIAEKIYNQLYETQQ